MSELLIAPNVSTVAQRSPFRYPGGKTWCVPWARLWLQHVRPAVLVEPFAGGGSLALAAIFEDLVERVLLVERDPDVACAWRGILWHGDGLACLVEKFEPTPGALADLEYRRNDNCVTRALWVLVQNRVRRGGILADGAGLMKRGEADRGIASRWYPETLAGRIREIHARQERIDFLEGDGRAVMEGGRERTDAAWFIDPPYAAAGRRLYRYGHVSVRDVFDAARCLCGDFLLTYEASEEVRDLVRAHGLTARDVAMKNTHNRDRREVLLGRNLDWLEDE